ncbi:hypothetical protein ACLOJK_001256 [Asimina triloba]
MEKHEMMLFVSAASPNAFPRSDMGATSAGGPQPTKQRTNGTILPNVDSWRPRYLVPKWTAIIDTPREKGSPIFEGRPNRMGDKWKQTIIILS